MARRVCLDASFVLEIILGDEHWQRADRLLNAWLLDGDELIVPPLFHAEATSVIRRRVHRKMLRTEEARDLVAAVLTIPVMTWIDTNRLQSRAFELSTTFNRPKAYDAQYLAVADLSDCPLWTADKKLFNAVSHHVPWVHYVGEAA